MIVLKKSKKAQLLIAAIFFLGNVRIVHALEIEGKIHKNVYVENIELSHLSKSEAKEKINNVLDKNRKINLTYNNEIYTIDLNDMEIEYKVDEAVDKAYQIGREDSLINDIKLKIGLDFGNKKEIDLGYNYNEEKIYECINKINKKVYAAPINATAKIENGELVFTDEQDGLAINKEKLKNDIISKVENIYGDKIKINTQKISPKCTKKELSKIDTVLGSYETNFNPKNENRVNNIKVAANATKNIILLKGDQFSFNNLLLEYECESKFKEASVIVNGKLEKGIGGGICQVSSTIYNAALYSGLDIINIKNHSIPSEYISKGRDATVSIGDIDFKFRNNYESPILIYNEVLDNKVVSTIYGSKNDKKEIEILTEITETLPNNIVKKYSEDLYIGQKIIEEEGRVGYKVNTFRIYKENNNEKKEFVYESYYPPKDKIILSGTKSKKVKGNIENNLKTDYVFNTRYII